MFDTRTISSLAPTQRFREMSASTFNTVSARYLKGRPDDVFFGPNSIENLYRHTTAAGVDPTLMHGLGFRAKSNPGGKWGTVWMWVTLPYEREVLTNRGMQDIAARMGGTATGRPAASGKKRHGTKSAPKRAGGISAAQFAAAMKARKMGGR